MEYPIHGGYGSEWNIPFAEIMEVNGISHSRRLGSEWNIPFTEIMEVKGISHSRRS